MPYNEKSRENLQPNIKTTEQAQKMGSKGGKISQANRKARQRKSDTQTTSSSLSKQKNNLTHQKMYEIIWRRRRDSNSRTGFPAYALSRGASSPT